MAIKKLGARFALNTAIYKSSFVCILFHMPFYKEILCHLLISFLSHGLSNRLNQYNSKLRVLNLIQYILIVETKLMY